MLDIPCIIFAGGKSSRMGEDKSLLPFGSFSTLTEYQHSKLSNIFTNVYISCKNKSKFDFEANFIEDLEESTAFAPSSGFIAAFYKLNAESFFVISVDTPFIDELVIQKILHADKRSSDATIAKSEFGVQTMCGIYHRSLYTSFLDMQKNDTHKLGFLLKNAQTTYVYFEDEKPFLNLNYPNDYQKALKLL